MPYLEFAVASNFSFLRGASHPEELAAACSVLGLAGFAIADRKPRLPASCAGTLRPRRAGRPALCHRGCRLVFRDGTGPTSPPGPPDRAAYGRLCRLLTTGNLRVEKGECHLNLADLLEWGKGLEIAVLPGQRKAVAASGSSPAKRGRGTMRSMVEGAKQGAPCRGSPPFPPPCGGPPSPVACDRGGFSAALFACACRGVFPATSGSGRACLYRGDDARRLAEFSALRKAIRRAAAGRSATCSITRPERRRLAGRARLQSAST